MIMKALLLQQTLRPWLLTILFLTCSVTSSIAQNDNIDCYSKHKAEYDKVGLKSIVDKRLKMMLRPFFELGDQDSSKLFFFDYKPIIKNDSVVYFNIDKGLAKGYAFRIETQKFDSTKHKITERSKVEICDIDNKVFWGTDGGFPNQEIKSFKVSFNNQRISLPKDQFNDLYDPSFQTFLDGSFNVAAKMDKKGLYFIIVLFGSDGAGSYCAIWIFKNGKYLKRVVDTLC